MSKKRRGGFVFLSYKGDHSPRHVHVYCDGRFVVKWDLESGVVMQGSITARIKSLIEELESEGAL